MGRPSIKSYGFNFVDDLQRHWRQRGTANLPIRFLDTEGAVYALSDTVNVKTEGVGIDAVTVVSIVKIGE